VSAQYEFAISGEASRFLFGRSDRVRTKAADIFEHLARHPFTAGDFQETAPSGRTYEVRVFDDLIVTYWADHSAREIRIIRCELVE